MTDLKKLIATALLSLLLPPAMAQQGGRHKSGRIPFVPAGESAVLGIPYARSGSGMPHHPLVGLEQPRPPLCAVENDTRGASLCRQGETRLSRRDAQDGRVQLQTICHGSPGKPNERRTDWRLSDEADRRTDARLLVVRETPEGRLRPLRGGAPEITPWESGDSNDASPKL